MIKQGDMVNGRHVRCFRNEVLLGVNIEIFEAGIAAAADNFFLDFFIWGVAHLLKLAVGGLNNGFQIILSTVLFEIGQLGF